METETRAGQRGLFGDDDGPGGEWEPSGPAFDPPPGASGRDTDPDDEDEDRGGDEDEGDGPGGQFRAGPRGGRYLASRAIQGECAAGGGRAIVALGYLLPCHACGRALLATDEAQAIGMAGDRGWAYWRGHNVCADCLATHGRATEALARAGRVVYEEGLDEHAARLDLEEHGRPQPDGTVLVPACPACMVGQIADAGLPEGFLRCDHCGLAWGLPEDQGVLGEDEA